MHMPFIRTTTNVNLDEAQEKSLREGTAELIKDILGKDPIRMMTAYEGGVHLSRGTGEIHHVPTAFVECKFFGGGDYEVFEQFDQAMHELYRKTLSIEPVNLYIKYEVINGWDKPAQIFKI